MERSDWNVSPEEGNRAVEQGFLRVVQEHLEAVNEPEHAAIRVRAVMSGWTDLQTLHAHWVVDEPSRYHLRLTALVLAAYRVLRVDRSRDDALAIVREAFITPLRRMVREGTAAALDHAPDPFAQIADISKERERSFYGQAFVFERPQDDAHVYQLDITGCFYHRFFGANGAPEIVPIFCDWDTNWMEAVVPTQHGVRTERPTTLGYGGDRCRFQFFRFAPDRTPA